MPSSSTIVIGKVAAAGCSNECEDNKTTEKTKDEDL